MTIRYEPRKILNRIMKQKTLKRLVKGNLTINRAALNTLVSMGIIPKDKIEEVAIRVINEYKKRFRKNIVAGESKEESKDEALNGKKELIQRTQNLAVFEISNNIQEKYRGEFYRWLPSSAENPDPEHQLNYGEIFQIGVGEMPGQRYGCKCGMEILVDDKRLKL